MTPDIRRTRCIIIWGIRRVMFGIKPAKVVGIVVYYLSPWRLHPHFCKDERFPGSVCAPDSPGVKDGVK
ncbi:unnamed protein product [Pleuronectes platessa]|uniref:Uncharacterized protein n=1 Tax=Pleuronectes platessa TaxID=8262 RepID=A0A9N7Z906_PLEPL|nr:unnamed protein product [Pleuronectes platessa]